jgi:hypothetical protein
MLIDNFTLDAARLDRAQQSPARLIELLILRALSEAWRTVYAM